MTADFEDQDQGRNWVILRAELIYNRMLCECIEFPSTLSESAKEWFEMLRTAKIWSLLRPMHTW